MTFKSIVRLLPALATTLLALPVHASTPMGDVTGLTATAGAAGLGGTETSIAIIVGRFIGAGLALLGVVFVVLIIYAGVLWMTAQGNDEKVKTAKKIVSSAAIGLVLIFASYAITSFVVGALQTATSQEARPQDDPNYNPELGY